MVKGLTTASQGGKNQINRSTDPSYLFAPKTEKESDGLFVRFNVLHPERLPSVIERYNGQVRRVLSVLETFLGGEKTWLVRDKCTFADLSFMPWNTRLDFVLMTKPGEDPLAPYPNVQAWPKRMVERPAWKRAMAVRDKLMDEQGLMPNGMPKGINNIKEYEECMEKLAGEAQEAKQAV